MNFGRTRFSHSSTYDNCFHLLSEDCILLYIFIFLKLVVLHKVFIMPFAKCHFGDHSRYFRWNAAIYPLHFSTVYQNMCLSPAWWQFMTAQCLCHHLADCVHSFCILLLTVIYVVLYSMCALLLVNMNDTLVSHHWRPFMHCCCVWQFFFLLSLFDYLPHKTDGSIVSPYKSFFFPTLLFHLPLFWNTLSFLKDVIILC